MSGRQPEFKPGLGQKLEFARTVNAPGHRDLVATVALADFYVCLFDIGDAGNRYPDPSRLAGLLEQCRLHWGDIVDLAASVEAEIRKAEIFLQI